MQLSGEKLQLAKKVYAYIDCNLTKISNKMKSMEIEDQGFATSKGISTQGKRSNRVLESEESESEDEYEEFSQRKGRKSRSGGR